MKPSSEIGPAADVHALGAQRCLQFGPVQIQPSEIMKIGLVLALARFSHGLSGKSASVTPLLWWGLVAAVVGGLWWWLFHRYRRWTTWFVGVLPFLLVLFFFYANLERVLPTNY